VERASLPRGLPAGLEELRDLALDLRWTWSHAADDLWRRLDAATWERTENPWILLQDISRYRLLELAANPELLAELQRLAEARRQYLAERGWYGSSCAGIGPALIAYFCMEFGLGEALPLYAGGLGVLAGDYLKAASDLGIPAVGVGLLYQEGYFRQMLGPDGEQVEVYPYTDPISLPIQPVLAPQGGWLHVLLELPGRTLHLRVWEAIVGRVRLYLLDSNDPLNSPVDRGITGKLYGSGREVRLLQAAVLGIGGWRALEAMGLQVDICHMNEGHAALVVLERARSFMKRHGVSFWEAFWATRAGNIFTTHTSVAAGMDTYEPALLQRFLPYLRRYLSELGVRVEDLVALGRRDPRDPSERFNMAYFAMRGSIMTNAVSQLHEEVSRKLFQVLYPRWPEREVPITHVTNGVHVPSWDSPMADRVWETACGKERWLGGLERVDEAIRQLTDEEVWAFRTEARRALVQYTRRRLAIQLGYRDAGAEAIEAAAHVLDPKALTLGFARRFAEYKRPTLLLRDRERLIRLLTDSEYPVQLVVAGKAHPDDAVGKVMIKEWVELAQDPRVRPHLAFLEDYDLTMAQELVRGVDVWINTPRRPWEASGTSGMKVLANGGLNVSELDGWWAEAYGAGVGWALGDGREHDDPDWDDVEADELYRLLEREIVPEFYARDSEGIPRSWVARIRGSMATLAPRFSANRMAREYVEKLYLPAHTMLRRRTEDGARVARLLHDWQTRLERDWGGIRFGNLDVQAEDGNWSFSVRVELGDVDPAMVQVELYADPQPGLPAVRRTMERQGPILGGADAVTYRSSVPADRPAADFAPRIVPYHPDALVPLELQVILWQR